MISKRFSFDYRISALILLAVGILVYAGAMRGPFFFDDYALVVNNPHIRSFSSLLTIFADVRHLTIMGHSYRPLQLVSYMVDYKLWQFDSCGYHSTSIALHMATALFLVGLLARLGVGRLVAFFVGVFFLIHPVQTGAVAYISGRADVLMVLFFVLTLWGYVLWVEQRQFRYGVATVLAFTAALASKTLSIQLLLVVVLLHFFFFRRRSLRLLVVVWCVGIGFAFLRRGAVSASPIPIPLLQRLLTVPTLFFKYLRLLLMPDHLHLAYTLRYVTSPVSIRFLLPLLEMILFICGGFYLVRGSAWGKWGLSVFLVNFACVSNIVPLNAPMAEHWLYWGVVGFFVFVGALAHLVCQWRWQGLMRISFIIVAAILACCFAGKTVERVAEWADPVRFYEKEISFTPANHKAHFNLGMEYFNRQRFDAAAREFAITVRIKPRYARGYFGLGFVAARAGRRDEAILLYKKALEIDPTLTEAQVQLEALQEMPGP